MSEITVRHRSEDVTVTVTLVREGAIEKIRGRERRVGQVYEVTHDGERLGFAHYRMLTRERRTPGRRYVNARWQSPGWVTSDAVDHAPSYREQPSRKAVIESLLWDRDRRAKEQDDAD